jgi:uncharacterized membrane protein YeaQ/YmgE (transglycosylase-associated protein family)
VVGALILGFIAGAVARFLIPGDAFRKMSGPASWGVSILVGLAGAFLGWLIFTKVFGIGDDDIFDLGGIVGAIIGTMILLPIVTVILRRTNRSPA